MCEKVIKGTGVEKHEREWKGRRISIYFFSFFFFGVKMPVEVEEKNEIQAKRSTWKP